MLVLAVLFITNPNEEKLISKINNSDDYIVASGIRESQVIVRQDGYYSKYFTVKKWNGLLFSTYKVHYGWFGTLNMAGMFIDDGPKHKVHGFDGEISFLGLGNNLFEIKRKEENR